MIEARCHCGKLKLDVKTAPEWVGSCNCSICRRTGGLWAYYPPVEVRCDEASKASSKYVWGDRTLTLHFCGNCGCVTHWTPADPAYDRMGVNARMMPDVNLDEIEVRPIDGASF
ncbi:MAG: hypothetical protein A3E78_01290 [Alphaproteobacteria bacterium RIFCSPHIGHO2_12_FULL_63_12]|nr:MAG: hypothetical protein A3E78_01290 [Alphaproteobacteria bacterium RIFCSPHIGHO2_12_FULL_63_12]